MEPTFAQRYGYRSVRDKVQLESMDAPLRNALWDAVLECLTFKIDSGAFRLKARGDAFVELTFQIWNSFFNEPTDQIPRFSWEAVAFLRNWFMSAAWYDVYSFVEFIVARSPYGSLLRRLADTYMKREMAAYRFVGNQIAQITDENEIREIETALTRAEKPVSAHLSSALGLLADRTTPDYRNSVKESISAVEAAAKALTGDPKAMLPEALKTLPTPLHPAFQKAVITLYGYTSDANGIRHALTDESNVDAAEARFMLIACSAFVNFLRERAAKPIP